MSNPEHEIDEAGAPVGPDAPPIGGAVLEETEALLEAEGRIRSGRLAGKPLGVAIAILALPVLIQQAMAAMLGLFDKIIAGNLEPSIVVPALDGVGVASYVLWFVTLAMAGLGIGGQALIARGMGAGNARQAHHALGQSISMSLVWGVVVGIALWFGAGPLATLCGLSEQSTLYCVQYVRTVSFAMPACAVMMVGSMCLHGAGETFKPSVIAVVINFVNIPFSWFLSGAAIGVAGHTVENPSPFQLDVVGIAGGTAVSYLVGAGLILTVLIRGVKDLTLEAGHMPFDRPMMWRIVRIGIPNFLEGLSMWAVNILVLQLIGQIAESMARDGQPGEGLQGAHVIAVQWEAISFMPGFAIGVAAAALAGQYLGAGNPRMARRAVLVCTGLACLMMGLLGIVFIVGGELLTRIVSTQQVHLEHTPPLLFIAGLVQVFFATTMVLRQGLRGVGDTKWTFLITTTSSYGVRLPAAWLLGVHLGYGLEGIWVGLCGELIVRAALFAARFFHGGWQKLEI